MRRLKNGAFRQCEDCLSEASPAAQFFRVGFVLTGACNMVSLGSFSLSKQREEHEGWEGHSSLFTLSSFSQLRRILVELFLKTIREIAGRMESHFKGNLRNALRGGRYQRVPSLQTHLSQQLYR